MRVIRTIKEMTDWVDGTNDSIALVPTQGCLHHGHESLLHAAKQDADTQGSVVMSLFVNPLQFRKHAYEAYPRQEQQDLELAENAGVDIVFAPEVFGMYPEARDLDWLINLQNGQSGPRDRARFTIDHPEDTPEFEYVRVPQRLTHRMDGIDHPWHFDGVATVVRKLFQIIQPNTSYFGLKDVQQLAILQSLNLWMGSPTKIVPIPVVRDHDGLSSSSRLVMLDNEQRSIACQIVEFLYAALQQIRSSRNTVAESLQEFRDSCESIEIGMNTLEIDALTYSDSTTLEELDDYSKNGVLYLAYIINGIRLAETLSQ